MSRQGNDQSSKFIRYTQTKEISTWPPYLKFLFNGVEEIPEFDVPPEIIPAWLDVEKFRRGQKFAMENLFCINMAEALTLITLFAEPDYLGPLIFTGKSHTPFKSCLRYLSTFSRVRSWYEDEFFGDDSKNSSCWKNIALVSTMHRNTGKRINDLPVDERCRRSTLGDESKTCVWSTIRETLKEDFKSSIPAPVPQSNCPKFHTKQNSLVPALNQLSMAITQMAFVGFAVTFPKQFGLHYASEEELDDFVHLWQGLGHYLGIRDCYNFCNEGLQGVRNRTAEVIKILIKPSLRNVSSDWEHMSRCLIQGANFYVPGFTFESSLKLVCEILEIPTPRLDKTLSYSQIFAFYHFKLYPNVLCRIPGMTKYLSKIIVMAADAALNAPREKLEQWESTKFSYMEQPDKVPLQHW